MGLRPARPRPPAPAPVVARRRVAVTSRLLILLTDAEMFLLLINTQNLQVVQIRIVPWRRRTSHAQITPRFTSDKRSSQSDVWEAILYFHEGCYGNSAAVPKSRNSRLILRLRFRLRLRRFSTGGQNRGLKRSGAGDGGQPERTN
ncbi:hypothetical protein EVAR_90812_1 [Eumeta japonica]|uniref:Uncharacterized protein n=1 Tax=Eumeta variegata TaxID=151549 RepID=A0A4C2A7E3_EUMVA|nr:hypothetical protein EVAR_90812_1 [Eumeta japonica]